MQPNDGVATLNHLFFHHLDRYQFDRLLSFQNRGELMVWSTGRFSRAVYALRRFLLDSGLAPGDRVAVFSENRPEWHISDFALLISRLVVVPIYNTLAPAQIAYQLKHSACRAAVIAGEAQWKILRPLLSELPEMETVVAIEDTPGIHFSLPRIIAEAPIFDEAAVNHIRTQSLAVRPQDLATIVYTSGTTGQPKGVMLSHGNIIADLRGSLARVPSNTAHQAISVLPLPHVLERTLSYGYFHEGVRIAYGDPHDLKELLPIHRPDIIGVVPRILEKIKEAIDAEIGRQAPHRRAIARKLVAAAVARKKAELQGEVARFSDGSLTKLANLAVFPKVHRQLYGLKYFISGGAWLNPELEIFFRAAGFDVLQGYGMTETSPVITLNEFRREKIGSVGRALDQVELRISEDGEIVTRGPNVMLGYYNDDAATRQIFDREGWLHTGDLGSIAADGCLTITGRRKEILVLSNGKNVPCALLEHALERSHYIQQALIVGDGRKFVTALIVAHRENVSRVAGQQEPVFSSYDKLLSAPHVVALFREELERLQTEFSSFERVKRFCFLHEEALQDIELVTPTQKVRRAVLERKYAEWIQQMYHQEDPVVIPRLVETVSAGTYKT